MVLTVAPVAWCSVLAPPASGRMSIADETAVVLWNPNTHTECLIDRVTFGGETGAPFGYLIPTPVTPRIETAPDDPTRVLNRVYHPRIVRVEKTGFQAVSGLDWIRKRLGKQRVKKAPAAPEPASDDQANAYFQAASFRAADIEGISDWLRSNGLAESPGLAKWLKPYAFRRWTITAFLVDPAHDARNVVRPPAFMLAFRSFRPYFPSREPADSAAQTGPGQPGRLRIYLISDARMTAEPGLRKDTWTGATRWATPLPDDRTDPLDGEIADQFGLTPRQMPLHPWITVLQDDTPVHGNGSASDLMFTPAPHQEAQDPVVTISTDRRVPVPADLCAVGVGVFVTLVVMQRAARRASARRRRQAKAAAALAARHGALPNRIVEAPPPPSPPRAARPVPAPMAAPVRNAPPSGPAYKKTRKRNKSGLRALVQRLLNRKTKPAPPPPRRATAADLTEPWNGQPATSVKRSDLLAEALEHQPFPPETDATPWIEIPTTMASAPTSFSVGQAEAHAPILFSVGPAEAQAPGEATTRVPVWIKGETPPPAASPEPPVLVVHPPRRSPFKRRRRSDADAYFPADPGASGDAYFPADPGANDGSYPSFDPNADDGPASLAQ